MSRMSLYSLLISMSLIACQKNTMTGNTAIVVPATNMVVAYGSHPSQKMDVYLPEGRSAQTTKVMVMIHGGGWSTGDKADLRPYVDSIKKRLPDYAIININYRLSANGNTHLFPTQENDVRSAIEFLYAKKDDYKISDRFVLLGASAGGHLALLQAYKYESPIKVKAVVDFFGPTDMTDLYYNPASPMIPSYAISNIVGATPSSNPQLYTSSSPIEFVTPQSPPTIILHGGADPVVSSSQSLALKNKLQSKGVINQYVTYPSEGHGWYGNNLTHSFNQVVAFLQQNVN